MVNEFCSNGTMVHTESYSSPIPLIGFYITVASMICFVLIICDVYVGIRRRKIWLPCRFFALNSITLTLLSVCTKIPVDLTTPMPSAQDQLSKLTGTVFICIAMGFMMPSIGINGEFESYANITALSIYVITVVVNICIQMATGVIFNFIVEHALIMFCMLLLLVRYWHSVVDVNGYKGVYTDQNKDLIRKGEQGFLQRLKVCYLHGYPACPQFLSCKLPYLGHVTLVCTTCSLVLVEAILRSFAFKDLKFCRGTSDYGWSVWLMVITQTLTILVVSLAIVCRWLTFARHIDENLVAVKKLPYEPYLQFLYLFTLVKYFPVRLEMIFKFVIYYPLFIIDSLLIKSTLILSKIVTAVIHKCSRDNYADEKPMEEFKDLLETHQVVVEQWVLRKGVDDMERWMKKSKEDRPKKLIKLLSDKSPSQESLTNGLNAGNEVSCLSMLMLVEIARVSFPTDLNETLINIFDEVFEIIYFIEDNINSGNFKKKLRSTYARVLWKFGLGKVVKKEMVKKTYNEMAGSRSQSPFSSDHALGILREFQQSFVAGVIREEARDIMKFISRRHYSSSEDLYDHIERLFVDMLHVFLAQFPDALFNHILESPIEEYDKRIRISLDFICKLQSLESRITWSFPMGSNIAYLFGTDFPGTTMP